jgi:hypothetical protein
MAFLHEELSVTSNPLNELDLKADPVGDALIYPGDLDTITDNWMMFQRYVYNRRTLHSGATAQKTGNSLHLPLPMNLATSYNTSWKNIELGIAGAQMVDTIGQGVKAGYNKIGAVLSGQTPMNNVQDFSAAIGDIWRESGIKGSDISNYLAAGALDSVASSAIGAVAGFSIGRARNPQLAMIFYAPEFRTYTFEYKLFARNFEESQTIDSIIQQFKIGMSPSFDDLAGNNLYKYPDMFELAFRKPKYLFHFKMCALVGFQHHLHADNIPLYFEHNGDKIPASQIIQLQFQELEIVTRDDFKEGRA